MRHTTPLPETIPRLHRIRRLLVIPRHAHIDEPTPRRLLQNRLHTHLDSLRDNASKRPRTRKRRRRHDRRRTRHATQRHHAGAIDIIPAPPPRGKSQGKCSRQGAKAAKRATLGRFYPPPMVTRRHMFYKSNMCNMSNKSNMCNMSNMSYKSNMCNMFCMSCM
jgi:hypothetical protein